MTANIYVLDTETTGLGGAVEGDVVVELGIARVDLDKNKVYPELGRVIRQELTPAQRSSWVFENTDLTPEEVEDSPWPVAAVRTELEQYNRSIFTAYNREFDFDRFLVYKPWFFKPAFAPCIMHECADRYNSGRWFKAQEAYDLLCPDNPAGVDGGREEHRALSDAVLEGHILIRLCEKNPEIRKRYVDSSEEDRS